MVRAHITYPDGSTADLEFESVSELVEWEQLRKTNTAQKNIKNGWNPAPRKTRFGDEDVPRMAKALQEMTPGAVALLRRWALNHGRRETSETLGTAADGSSSVRGVGAALASANRTFEAHGFRPVVHRVDRRRAPKGIRAWTMGASQFRVLQEAVKSSELETDVEEVSED